MLGALALEVVAKASLDTKLRAIPPTGIHQSDNKGHAHDH